LCTAKLMIPCLILVFTLVALLQRRLLTRIQKTTTVPFGLWPGT
jgi:hypothetical protein